MLQEHERTLPTMGMSASQARFLTLTARKTNVEYEGQQINQQRTTLSNESANYYSKLSSMSVPIPPSSEDYTKITYTFKDGSQNNTVTSIIAKKTTKDDGIYMLNYVQETPAENMVVNGTNVISRNNGKYYIGKVELQNASSVFTSVYTVDVPVSDTEEETKYLTREKGNTKTAEYMVVTDGQPDKTKYFIRKEDIVDDNTITKEENGVTLYYIPTLGGWVSSTTSNITKGEYDKDSDGNNTTLITEDETEGFILDNTKFNVDPKTGKFNVFEEISAAEAGIVNEDTRESVVARFIAAGIPTEVVNNYSNEELRAKLQLESQYRAMAVEKYADKNWSVRYIQNSSTGSYEPVYYSGSEIANVDFSEKTSLSVTGIKAYMYGETTETKEIKNAEAKVEKDASGRYQALYIFNDETHTSGTRYELTATTETDDSAYNDAMNQYFYDKTVYDKMVEEVNAKIGIIQAQDKNLELKLKQLDTEENAISTEMEAVKKVISKNVESSFKTFNA